MLALGLSLVGAVVDMQLEKQLSLVFDGAYFIGCVGAVALVRRRNLFGPMVQSPLILAVVVPATVVMTSGLGSGGKSAKLLALATPMLNAFPLMAITAGAVVLIGGIRYAVQRRPAEDDVDDAGAGSREARRRPAERPDRQGAGARRGRSADGARPGQGRTTASRSAAPDRRGDRGGDRGGSDRAGDRGGSDRGADRGADRGVGRERGADSPRGGRGVDRGGRSGASDRGARGGSARGGAGGQARRPSREDNRRQPPRRRGDDY